MPKQISVEHLGQTYVFSIPRNRAYFKALNAVSKLQAKEGNLFVDDIDAFLELQNVSEQLCKECFVPTDAVTKEQFDDVIETDRGALSGAVAPKLLGIEVAVVAESNEVIQQALKA